MKKPETLFKEKIQKRLKEINGLWFTKVQNVTVRGVPDLLICHKGKFIAWELKIETGRLDKLQHHILQSINNAGGTARVVSPANVAEAFHEDLGCEY